MNTEFRVLIVGEPKFDISTLINEITKGFDNLVVKRINEISDIMNTQKECWDIIIIDHHPLAWNESNTLKFIEEKIMATSS